MKWISVLITLTCTALISSSAYVVLVTVLNQGNGLGEDALQGFIYQVIFHFIITVIPILLIVLPLYILLKKKVNSQKTFDLIIYAALFMVTLVTYILIVRGVGNGWWLAMVPSIFSVLALFSITHLLRHSWRFQG